MKKKVATRRCVKCGRTFPLSKGVLLLRGISFACKNCYRKEKRKTAGKKVCRFC